MLKILQTYFKPDLDDTIEDDLEDAHHALYEYRMKAEYYNHTVQLYMNMIIRLEKMLEERGGLNASPGT
jgi:hypothetical protein